MKSSNVICISLNDAFSLFTYSCGGGGETVTKCILARVILCITNMVGLHGVLVILVGLGVFIMSMSEATGL